MPQCRPWLQRQIRLVNPALVLLAESTAMTGVLGIKTGITKMRGQWMEREGRMCLPTAPSGEAREARDYRVDSSLTNPFITPSRYALDLPSETTWPRVKDRLLAKTRTP